MSRGAPQGNSHALRHGGLACNAIRQDRIAKHLAIDPKTLRKHLSYYIQQLNADLAAKQEQRAKLRAENDRVATHAARERLTPLEERLSRLLATIPIEIQREGLSLASLQDSLRGRWRGNCHPGELGTALRKLDFKRERRWHDEGGFRALWYPKK